VNRESLGSFHRKEHGTSFIETVIVGFTVMLVTLPILLTVVRMSEASDTANSEAQAIATWVARHGVVPDIPTAGDIDMSVANGVVSVRSTVRVELLAISGSQVDASVSASVSVPISPYRSDP
jgi:hypothetical protein